METCQTIVARINDGVYDAGHEVFDENLEPECQWIQDLYKKISEHKDQLLKKEQNFYREVKKRQECLEQRFKTDCLEAAGLIKHPKADKAWATAWSKGHSNGREDILFELLDIAELLLD